MSVPRAHVAAIARSWLGTPYHHRARLKGIGVDCAYFAVEVYAEAGLLPRLDLGDYPQDWMLNRSEERFLDVVHQHAKEVQGPGIGDLIVMRWGRTYSHCAIVVDDGVIVHSFVKGGVIASELDEFKDRPMRYFTLFGVPR